MNELPFFRNLKKELSKKQVNLMYLGPPICKRPLEEIISLFKEGRRNNKSLQFVDEDIIFMLYLDALDGVGHTHGPNSIYWFDTLHIIDKKLEILCNVIKKTNCSYIFTLFSDHGCCKITHTIDILSYLKKTGLENITTAFVDATLTLLWIEKRTDKNRIIKGLQEILRNKAKIFDRDCDKKVLNEYGVAFNDRYYGDIIVQLEPGFVFFPNFYSGLRPLKGAHGYLPDTVYQKSFLLWCSNYLYDPRVKLSHIKDVRNLLRSIV